MPSMNQLYAGLAVLLLALNQPCQRAQAQETTSPQAKVDQLIRLLQDPDVRWLLTTKPEARSLIATPASTRTVAQWLDDIQIGIHDAAGAVRLIPGELQKVEVAAKTRGLSVASVFLSFIFVAALGYFAELSFALAARNLHLHHQTRTAHHRRLQEIGRTLFSRVAPVVVFSFASIAGFVVPEWPPMVGGLLLPALLALIAIRASMRLADVMLSPKIDRLAPGTQRLLPLPDAAARFWFIRVSAISSVIFCGWAAGGIMALFGVIDSVRALGFDVLCLVMLGIGIETVWRRPRAAGHLHWHGLFEWMVTLWLCVLWATTLAGFHLASILILYIVALPAALKTATAVVRTSFERSTDDMPLSNPVHGVLVERGVRAAIIGVSVLWPAMVLQLEWSATKQHAETDKFIHGIISGILILLSADVVWEVAKALISHRLAKPRDEGASASDLAHGDRLLTLLPIFRNFLAVLIAAVAIMMVASALGIEVGPLIAGAGIFGVAIGFGSQTLVRDVISGIFYMTDDAFRVGEYIQSGTYKGTVESFSLRSVRLRHHRGPIFTVPFGSLGAVENMSRDWVIDKFLISVGYQTDVALVKKLTKGVGAGLLEDPELGPLIIETVKMKGVEQFGDYGINLSFSMMTKPGQQSMVRRRALVMIREAFAANGIEFASPTVQVGRNGRATEQ